MKFLIMVEGHGFVADFGDGPVPIGFYANRMVEAPSYALVDRVALFNAIASDLTDRGAKETPNSRMHISEVSEFTQEPTISYSGFSFFDEAH